MILSHNIFRFDSIEPVSGYSTDFVFQDKIKTKIELKATLLCICNVTGEKIYRFKFTTEEEESILTPDKCIQNFLTAKNTDFSIESFPYPFISRIKPSKINFLDTELTYCKEIKALPIEQIQTAVTNYLIEYFKDDQYFIF